MKTKTYENIIELDPRKVESHEILNHLLSQYREKRNFFDNKIKHLSRNKVYTVYLPDPNHSGKKIAQKVQLTNDLVLRYRKLFGRKEPRYSVLDKNPLGGGYFSKVYRVLGTISHHSDGSMAYKTNKKRVMKVQEGGYGYHNAPNDPIKESLILQKFSSGAKTATIERFNPFHSRSYSIDEEFGQSLKSILEKKSLFTIDQRLEISINLLRQIQAFHHAGYAHSDIHPGNILINTQTRQVRLIDTGLTRKNNTQRTFEDIYYLNRVFLNLWKQASPQPLQMDQIARVQSIAKALTNLAAKPSSLDETIIALEQYRIKDKHPIQDEANLAINGFLAANQARIELDKIKQTLTPTSLTDIHHTIFNATEKMGDSATELQEFIRTLNVSSFNDIKTKNQLRIRTQRELLSFSTHSASLVELHNQIAINFKLASRFPDQFTVDQKSKLHALMSDVQTSIYKIQKRRMCLDDIHKVNQDLRNTLTEKWQTFFAITDNVQKIKMHSDLILGLQLEQTNYSNDANARFRNNLRLAARNYILSTYTASNSKRKDRAASDERIQTIQNITDLLKQSQEGRISNKQLFNSISYEVHNNKYKTGFFGGSMLRANINKVLKERKRNLSS